MDETTYRTIRISEDAYQKLEDQRLDGESLSDTVERIVGDRSLLDLAGILSEAEAEELREAIHDRNERGI
ncbi:antitoxin VapB family protein [Natronolimnobius baerhuensis]|uniref:Antitoxin n=1 Tax=Natronolimnobius baerhuensis TaxID=253108 RepID=A0A202EDF7_9EURY|nr:antitoxin VapB family protein [Natronolimnobius baerhuensis]OVE86030.1 hypothetical protein B2G88_04335 [Natronolimnobius baerhuensis]